MASSTEAGWTQTTPNTSAWTTPDSNQSLADVYKDCIVIGLNKIIPWDNPHNLISQETENLIERVKSTIFIPVMFLVGVPCNLLNMAVFVKQGLKDRINMCLFALAVADLLNITWRVVMYAERIYTQNTSDERYTPSFRYLMNNNVLGLSGLIYGPPVLSAIIATERCVCVLFPLRAKKCVPTKTLAAIILVTLTTMVALLFFVTSKFRAKCFHEMLTGRTSWQVYASFKSELHKTWITGIDGIFYGFIVSVGCPAVVFFTTTITAIRLRQIIQWRRQAASSSASSSSSPSALSSKEVGLTKMLICLSVEFFVLSLPVVVVRIWPLFQEELNGGGRYTNTKRTLNTLNQFCFFTSSSINFFVYYCAGSKFRETLHSMMSRLAPADKNGSTNKFNSMKNRLDDSSVAVTTMSLSNAVTAG